MNKLLPIIFVLLVAIPASAQFRENAERATVIAQSAPIYLDTQPGRIPLRVAAEGTSLEVISGDAQWLNVRFNDPQFGLRVGYVEAKLVRRDPPPSLRPMDLSVPLVREPPPQVQASTPQRRDTFQPQQPFPQQRDVSSRPPLARDGKWFSVGLGVGTLGCFSDCFGRIYGGSGGLTFGTTLNEHWLMGVGTSGFVRSSFGETITAGTVDLRFRAYPVLTQGFFITFGGGLGTLSYDSYFGEEERHIGASALGGVGWDLRVGRNVSLTPFYNWAFLGNTNGNLNYEQLGLAVTIH
jgi:hypothetical protein